MSRAFWRMNRPASIAGAQLNKPEEPAPVLVKEPMPVAVSMPVTIAIDDCNEYFFLVGKIKWDTNFNTEEGFRHFFVNHGITVFPFNKVQDFLDSEFGLAKDGAPTWYWRPLREQDMKSNERMNESYDDKNGKIDNDNWYHVQIPVPVLMTVEMINEEFPEALFFVSESIVGEGGSFLVVTARGAVEMFVIEHWITRAGTPDQSK